MARDDMNFRNEPKGLGPKPEKAPRAARSTAKAASGATTPTAPAKATAPKAVAPKTAQPKATEPKTGTGVVPDGTPPRKVEPAPQESGITVSKWFARVPWFIGIVGLPVVLVIYGFQQFAAARRGTGAGIGKAIAALVVGGGIIAVVIGAIAYENLRPGTSHNVDALKRGDCFLEDGLGGLDGGEVRSTRTIDCDEPHFGQVFLTGELTDSSYRGQESVSATVAAICDAAVEDNIEFLATDPDVYLTSLFPTEAGWRQGDQGYDCLLVTDGNDVLTRSLVTD